MDENQMIDTTDVDVNETLDFTQDDDAFDVSNLTEADFYKEKARREKAEKLLVELKKQNKELKTKIPEGEFITKNELELSRLVDKEPELAEYVEDILAYTKKGLSVKEATVLVKASDKAIDNRKKAEELRISGGETIKTKTVYTSDELIKLSQSEYNKVRELMDKGEVTLKR